MFGKKNTEVQAVPGVETLDAYLSSITYDTNVGIVTIHKNLRGDVRIPVASVVSIDFGNAGVGMKYMAVRTAASMTEHARKAGTGKHKDATQDPNTVTFKAGRLDEFQALATNIEDAARGPVAAPAAPAADMTTQLASLAQLHADGVLNDDEYTSAKAKVLA